MLSGRVIVLLALVAGATAIESQQQDNNFCQGCRSLVSFAQVFNSSNRADYKDVIKSYCELYYPVSTDYQQGPCPLFVEGFYYIMDHTDPVHHCDQIGACGPVTSEMASEQPSDDIYEYFKNSIKDQPKRGDNVICEFCEQIVTQAKEALNDPATIDQVRRQLDSVCEFLKVIDQDKECRQYVDKYIDQAIVFIRDINPKEYCRSVQMCSANSVAQPSSQAPTKNQLANLPTLADFQDFGIETSVSIGERPDSIKMAASGLDAPATSHKAGLNCKICKTVVKELFNFLRTNKTEENIMKALDEVCSLVYRPGPNRDQCDGMVKAYTKELIQMLMDETDPEMICMLLEQCVYEYGSKSDQQPLTETALATGPTPVLADETFGLGDLISALDQTIKPNSLEACIECKIFIKYLKEKLGDQKTQDELTEWIVSNLCAELNDSKLITSCSNMVQKNAPTFFKALSGRLSSHAACAELGVCPANSLVSVFRLDGQSLSPSMLSLPLLPWPERQPNVEAQISKKILNRPLEFKAPYCDQCIETVTQIDDYLSKHPVDQDVATLIDKVCNQLPEGAARDKCTYIIEVFGAEIVQAISTMDNPRQLCSKFYLC